MATKIVTKNSSTGGSAPSASDLVQGELAVNVTDKRLYTENASGAIVELGTKPSTIDINAGTIDGAVIGGATPAAISGTTGQFGTSLNVDGTATMDAATVQTTGSTTAVLTLNNANGNGTLSQINLGYTADPDHGNISYTGDMIFTASAAERLRIDGSSGNVGIGTSSPAASLSLFAGTGETNGIKMQASGWPYYVRAGINGTSGAQYIQSTNWNANNNTVDSSGHASTAIIQDVGSGSVQFRTATTNAVPVERGRWDASGTLLVGTTASIGTSAAKLEVLGGSGGGRCINTKTAVTTSANAISFNNGNGQVGSIATNGSATAYNTSSDYRLKENVVPMTGSIDRVKALKPSRFNFIADSDNTVDGFLAHEAQAVVPECVTGTKDAMMDEEYEVTAAVEEVRDEDDNITTEASEAVMGTRSVPDMQGIDQSKLVPLLVAALQEAIARIETLEAGE